MHRVLKSLCLAFWLVPNGSGAQQLDMKEHAVIASNVVRTLPLTPNLNLRMQGVDRYQAPLLGVGRFEPNHEIRTSLESKLGHLLSGVVELRWTEDGKGGPTIVGVPVMVKLRHSTVVVGVNLRH